ncbi:macrophage mannose receptor 1-like [Saccostrea echinata]|uniref:macrophage mannose receptor 1-like n=1 Tax=Saccostrea echinata TaxID=191078 RepID=UPI002A7FE486|nr:macrophage mannose receptor 1-like [Saccostrea echinata]
MSTCKYPGPRIWRKENKTCICCGCAFPGITMNLTNSSGSSIIGYTPLPEPCIENYKLFFNGSEVACLRYEITTVNYSSALSDCRSEGGDLIKINSQSKNEFILKYIEFYGDLTLDVWLQGKLFNTSCIWVFEDDTEITFNFWNNREPKCDLDQPRKRARADRGFQWFDKVSSAAYPYLCEMNPFL